MDFNADNGVKFVKNILTFIVSALAVHMSLMG